MDSPGNVTYNKISERQDSKKMPERGGHEKVQQRKHTDGAATPSNVRSPQEITVSISSAIFPSISSLER